MKPIPRQHMPPRVPREGHTNVSLPDELADRVDEIVENGDAGYQSRAEFVRAAVRERLKDYD